MGGDTRGSRNPDLSGRGRSDRNHEKERVHKILYMPDLRNQDKPEGEGEASRKKKVRSCAPKSASGPRRTQCETVQKTVSDHDHRGRKRGDMGNKQRRTLASGVKTGKRLPNESGGSGSMSNIHVVTRSGYLGKRKRGEIATWLSQFRN